MAIMRKHTLMIVIAYIFLVYGCNNSEDSNNQDVKNIILIIGNSKVIEQSHTGVLSNTNDLNLLRATVRGISKNQTICSTNSNSGVGVFSIGKRSNSMNTLGLDSNGVAQPNLVELASIKGLSTGIITTSCATQAIPASFIVHAIDKNQYESIASEYLNSPIDLLIGGGLQYFNDRSDSADLIQRFKNKGYSVYNDIDKAVMSSKLVVLIEENKNEVEKITSNHLLIKSTDIAIKSLALNQNGFFLVIDGSQLKTSNDQTPFYLMEELIWFDQSVGKVFDFADNNPGTLVIVISDKELEERTLNKSNSSINAQNTKSNTTDESIVAVYAYGSLAKTFEGTYDCTEIFNKMVRLLDLSIQ